MHFGDLHKPICTACTAPVHQVRDRRALLASSPGSPQPKVHRNVHLQCSSQSRGVQKRLGKLKSSVRSEVRGGMTMALAQWEGSGGLLVSASPRASKSDMAS